MTCRVVALHSYPATVRRDQGLCRHGTGLVDWPPMTRRRHLPLSAFPHAAILGAAERGALALKVLVGIICSDRLGAARQNARGLWSQPLFTRLPLCVSKSTQYWWNPRMQPKAPNWSSPS